MVDALHEIHRVLRPHGLLIDARPDSRVDAPVEHREARGWRGVGTNGTSRRAAGDDRASDRAVATVKRQGLFASRGAGRFWYRLAFDDAAGLQRYLDEHLRQSRRVRWRVDASRRRRWRGDPFGLQRAVRYELLERLGER